MFGSYIKASSAETDLICDILFSSLIKLRLSEDVTDLAYDQALELAEVMAGITDAN